MRGCSLSSKYIAQIFGVTVDELLKGERSENPKSEEEGSGGSGDLPEEKNKKVIGGRLLKKSRFYVILSKE